MSRFGSRSRVPGPQLRPQAFNAYILLSGILSIIVLVNARIAVDAEAGHDDGLFMTLGRHLAAGQWLGPFNQYTLMKGPGYPLFLAAASWLGLSVSLAHALFHLAAVIFIVTICRRFIASTFAILVLFTLLLWHPIFFADPMLRVVREVVFSLQVPAFLLAFAWALLGAATPRERAFFALSSGLVLGWLWFTCEEGATILPGVAVVFLAAVYRALQQGAPRPLAVSTAIVVLSFAATQAAFQAANWQVYGAFVGVDVKERSFQRALGALQSVRSGSSPPFVAVAHATRDDIYRISPSFASLRPHFESPAGKTWEQAGCHTLASTCGEIGAGWFIWALRDAASAAGYYASPERAARFFGQVADEIEAACARKETACASFSVTPDNSWEQLGRFPARYAAFLRLALLLDRPPLNPGASSGDQLRLNEALQFLHHPLHTRAASAPVPEWTIHGWYYKSGDQWFSVSLKDRGVGRTVQFDRARSPDLAGHFRDPGASSQRFDLRFACTEDCILQISGPGGVTFERALADFPSPPFRWKVGEAQFHVDRLNRTDAGGAQLPLTRLSDHVRSIVLRYYNIAFLPVLGLGAAAFLIAGAGYRRIALANISFVIAFAAWTLVLTRVGFLAFPDPTSFQAWSFKSIGPSYFLLVCAAVLSIVAWLQLSRNWLVPAVSNAAGVSLRPASARVVKRAARFIDPAVGRARTPGCDIWHRLAGAGRASAAPAKRSLAAAVALLRPHRASLQIVTCLAVGAAVSLRLGQDVNWDLMNYHLYNVFWLLEGRRDIDFAAAGFHGFLSPLADIPYYLMAMKWLPAYPRAVGALQGLYFGALIFLVYRINARVFAHASCGVAPALVATIIGVTGAATIAEAGTTMNDIQVAALVLWAVLILLPLCESVTADAARRALFAGLLVGIAGGVKLTALMHVPAIGCAILLSIHPLRRSIRTAATFSAGWALGFALAYGWWGFILWDMTGNPFFPFYNGIFRSDWMATSNFTSVYKLGSWLDVLLYPFYWARPQFGLVTEMPFGDARYALAVVAILLLSATALTWTRRPASSDPVPHVAQRRIGRFIVAFFVVSHVIWLPLFVTLRYAIAIEVLTGTLVVFAIHVVIGRFRSKRLQTPVTVVLSLGIGWALYYATIYPSWGRIPFGRQVFSVHVPEMPPNSMIVVHGSPLSYVLPFVDSPGWSAVSVSWFTAPGYRAYDETKKKIAAHAGPIFVLYARTDPALYRDRAAELGVTWDNGRCRPVISNLTPDLALCDARRQ